MIRATKWAQLDICPACNGQILVTNWDDLEGIEVDAYRVDNTPLTPQDEAACIIMDRRTYLLEETIVGTWRLSRRWADRMQIPDSPHPVAVLPHHKCGARYPTRIMPPARPTFNTTTPAPF